jgi:hypothetical protein
MDWKEALLEGLAAAPPRAVRRRYRPALFLNTLFWLGGCGVLGYFAAHRQDLFGRALASGLCALMPLFWIFVVVMADRQQKYLLQYGALRMAKVREIKLDQNRHRLVLLSWTNGQNQAREIWAPPKSLMKMGEVVPIVATEDGSQMAIIDGTINWEVL